jgi:type IX secretion system PorP/SprF family membrane protein
MIRLPVWALLLLSAWARLGAQDLHFSQFYHNPQQHNPAQTGMFEGDLRAAALYRSQWTTVPVNYRTFAGAVDWKASRWKTNLLSVGLLVEHDRAGDAALTWTQVGATVAVAHAVGAGQALSAGFGLGLAQRSFDIGGLAFRNQWTGDVYDPSLPTGETFNRTSGLSPTLSAGLAWLWQPAGSRRRLTAGLGAFHLNRPAVGFHDDTELRLPMRFALQAQAAWPVGPRFDLVGFVLAGQMASAREVVAGGGVRMPWTTGSGAFSALQFTLATRTGDALIPALQLEYQSWTVGVSYDWNRSAFEAATDGRGGVEVAVVYRPLPVPPLKNFKACPIF